MEDIVHKYKTMALVYGVLMPANQYFEITATRRYGELDVRRLLQDWSDNRATELNTQYYLKAFLNNDALREPSGLKIYPLDNGDSTSEDDDSSAQSFYADCTHILVGLPAKTKSVIRCEGFEEIFDAERRANVHRRLVRFGFSDKCAFYFHSKPFTGSDIVIKSPKPLP